ncbi:MAG TPA: signal peptidase I, partial [Sulfitobacter sp.]|nr:signal peptidase I [Sulfitobacter sp.]
MAHSVDGSGAGLLDLRQWHPHVTLERMNRSAKMAAKEKTGNAFVETI